MIHHLARAFLIRDAALQRMAGHDDGSHPSDGTPHAQPPAIRPAVKPRPITPWSVPTRPSPAVEQRQPQGLGAAGGASPLRLVQGGGALASRRVRICTDPADARRTVIAGRFAEVCAALERLVREQEATA